MYTRDFSALVKTAHKIKQRKTPNIHRKIREASRKCSYWKTESVKTEKYAREMS